MMIPRIFFDMESQRTGGLVIRRLQFPVGGCLAATVDGNQGATLVRAGFDVRDPCFRHGQLGMAPGRVRRREDVVFLHPPGVRRNSRGWPYTINVVIPELIAAAREAEAVALLDSL